MLTLQSSKTQIVCLLIFRVNQDSLSGLHDLLSPASVAKLSQYFFTMLLESGEVLTSTGPIQTNPTCGSINDVTQILA